MLHEPPRSWIAYLRVSTAKQGYEGVSLQEQRRAIETFAASHGFEVSEWHTEIQSAASTGRTVFRSIIQRLGRNKHLGLLLHRIDRGTRNLWDWASLSLLIDDGRDIRFVHDDLDLHSRGGRLAADIQAVVAADYIRNLRDETRKGMRGRFLQGLYPLKAPIGYLDCGKGKPKLPNPATANFVQEAFRLYGSGRFALASLSLELAALGWKNRNGQRFAKSHLARLLHNSFYIGETFLLHTGETFRGIHEPLISRELFAAVHQVFLGRYVPKRRRARFLWSRKVRCHACSSLLVGERQKGRVYYRCHRCIGRGSACGKIGCRRMRPSSCSPDIRVSERGDPQAGPWTGPKNEKSPSPGPFPAIHNQDDLSLHL
jgi:DNA invertase Pin-like site-specific DNA recombinase